MLVKVSVCPIAREGRLLVMGRDGINRFIENCIYGRSDVGGGSEVLV